MKEVIKSIKSINYSLLGSQQVLDEPVSLFETAQTGNSLKNVSVHLINWRNYVSLHHFHHRQL